MHFGVDAAVAFLAMVVVVVVIFGVGLVDVAIAAVVIGVIAAPFTRRAEIRQLAERDAPHTGEPE